MKSTRDPSELVPILRHTLYPAGPVPAGAPARPRRAPASPRPRPGPPEPPTPRTGRPTLLDLFCKAGGAAVGYHRAGFEVLGVDRDPQPNYPFEAVRADALDYLREFGGLFDAVHASPPCQRFSTAAFTPKGRDGHPDLIDEVRRLLERAGKPWVIENVQGAPLRPPAVKLCGLMFGLKVFRHRVFESSELLFAPPHPSHAGKRIGKDGMCCVVGHGGGVSRRMREQVDKHGTRQTKKEWEKAMGIDWMTRDELAQAVPPAYTRHLGLQLLRIITNAKGE